MRAPNRPKQAHPRQQRRHWFHKPRQPRPQRRRGLHEQPKNTTHTTTTRPRTYPHETRDTNARRLTLTFETHVTNARPQQAKAGPTTPAKAMPVSRAAPSTPAKATPVSCASRLHCHRELSAARSHRSLTGSLAPICESPVDVSRVFHAHRPDTDTATATNLASPTELGSTPSPRTTATSSRHRSCAPELFAGTIMLTNASTSTH